MPRLIVLGSGSPAPSTRRWGTSFLLHTGVEWLLIDCGPATTYKLYRAGRKVTDIAHLFFTHLHSDHVSDYPCFLLTRFDMVTGREPPLNVYGPAPTRRMTDRLIGEDIGAFWPDVVARTNHPMSLNAYRNRGGVGERKPPAVHAHDIEPGTVASGPNWEVTATEVEHAQPYLTCLAYRVEMPNASIVFGGDTRPCDALADLARDADLLVMECTRFEADQTEAFGSAETATLGCARQAVDAGAKRLLVNHQNLYLDEPENTTRAIAEITSIYHGPLIWGEEGLEVEV